MTSPSVQGDPDDIMQYRGHWYERATNIDGTPPPPGATQWVSISGAQGVSEAGAVAAKDLQGKLGGAADNMGTSGQAYKDQEHGSAGGLKPSDMSSVMNSLVSAGTTLFKLPTELLQSLTSAGSSFGSAAASVGSSMASTVNSATSSASHGSAAAPLGGGLAAQQALPAIAGQNQPQDDQDNQQPDDQHHHGGH